jgi:hypothetical protein
LLIAGMICGAACGSSPTSPPPAVLFPLSAGAHRLVVAGTSCFIFSTGSSAGVSTSIEVPVTLTASGPGWNITAQDQPLTGVLSMSGSSVTGTLTGSVTLQGLEFVTGSGQGDTLTLNGSTPASGRVEGSVTAGSPRFIATHAIGSSMAVCQSGSFSLRSAT